MRSFGKRRDEETRNGGDEEAMGQGHAVSIIPPVATQRCCVDTTLSTLPAKRQRVCPNLFSRSAHRGQVGKATNRVNKELRNGGGNPRSGTVCRVTGGRPSARTSLATSVLAGVAALTYPSVLLHYPDRKVADFLVPRLPTGERSPLCKK